MIGCYTTKPLLRIRSPHNCDATRSSKDLAPSRLSATSGWVPAQLILLLGMAQVCPLDDLVTVPALPQSATGRPPMALASSLRRCWRPAACTALASTLVALAHPAAPGFHPGFHLEAWPPLHERRLDGRRLGGAGRPYDKSSSLSMHEPTVGFCRTMSSRRSAAYAVMRVPEALALAQAHRPDLILSGLRTYLR